MLNRLSAVGRLTRDPDLRSTASGTAVVSFSIAVDRDYTDKQGNRSADFLRCVAWNKTAENITSFCHKGSLVAIDGRVQTRSYEDKDHNKREATEVMIRDIYFLEGKKDKGAAKKAAEKVVSTPNSTPAPASTSPVKETKPQNVTTNTSIDDLDDSLNVDSTDLPF